MKGDGKKRNWNKGRSKRGSDGAAYEVVCKHTEKAKYASGLASHTCLTAHEVSSACNDSTRLM